MAFYDNFLATFCKQFITIWYHSYFDTSNGLRKGEIKKASELSGHSNLLFLRDSLTGKVLAKENKKSIKLNEELHDND